MALPSVVPLNPGQSTLTKLLNSKIRDAFNTPLDPPASLPAAVHPVSEPSQSGPDLSASFAVIDRAAQDITALGATLKRMAEFSTQREARFVQECEKLRSEAEAWQRAARDAEGRAQTLQAQLDAMSRRAETAEANAHEAQTGLRTLHDRVMTLLGEGSEADHVLSDLPIDRAPATAA
jgi:chromosome segregation ATPase